MDYVLFATYRELDTARRVVDELVEAGFPRGYIGLARKDNREDAPRDPLVTADMQAVVTVTVGRGDTGTALTVMRRHDPVTLDMRDVQWRMKGWGRIAPSEEEFTAVTRQQRR